MLTRPYPAARGAETRARHHVHLVCCTAANAPLVGPRLTDFPFRCQTDPTVFDATNWERLRKTYVRHTDPPLASLDLSRQRAMDAGFELHDLACGHDVMLADPEGTVAVLEQIARFNAA